jgi:hypothetical protein
LDEGIRQKIEFEINLIDEALNGSKPLLDLCRLREPDYVERAAVALLLHSFYNGIENILLIISKNIEIVLPSGIKWHKELLDKSFEETNGRKNVFRKENREILNEYLSFRHFVRHNYGFQIKWKKMEALAKGVEKVWEMAREDINTFIAKNNY